MFCSPVRFLGFDTAMSPREFEFINQKVIRLGVCVCLPAPNHYFDLIDNCIIDLKP